MKELARILVGPLAWLAGFSAVYGLHGLICGHGLDVSVGGVDVARALLVAAYGFAVATQAAIVWALHRPWLGASKGFSAFASRTTAWVGLGAAVWTLLPTITTTRCL